MIQKKWLCKLLGLDYVIECRRGKENIADALYQLSRVYLDDASCFVILAIVPAWMVELSNSYDGDHKAQQLIM